MLSDVAVAGDAADVDAVDGRNVVDTGVDTTMAALLVTVLLLVTMMMMLLMPSISC